MAPNATRPVGGSTGAADCDSQQDCNQPTLKLGENKAPLIAVGQNFGFLQVLATDSTGRRVTCRCRCDRIVRVAADALASDMVTSCGCAPSSAEHRRAMRRLHADFRRNVLFGIAGAAA